MRSNHSTASAPAAVEAAGRQIVAYNIRSSFDVILGCKNLLGKDVEPWQLSLPRPTGIFTAHDMFGAEVIAACRNIGLRVSQDIAVLSVDDDDLGCTKHVHVGRRLLERRVYQSLGISLGTELRRTRLEHAKRLLSQTDLSIAEVAGKSGFSSFRHLADAFRRELRQTPTGYRRAFRGASRSATDK